MAVQEEAARRELSDHFHDAVDGHPEIMAECLSILRSYNMSPSDLYFKYEAFLLSRPSGLRAKLSTLTLETARELRKEIQREQQAKAVASAASATGGEHTPKANIGMRKGKGNISDLGGFLDGLSTPSRPSKPRAPGTVPSRLSNTSNNANLPSSPATSAFTPSHTSFATPSRPSPAGASYSSYRPVPSKLAPPSTDRHLTTPVGKGGEHLAPSSPVSGEESPATLTPQLTQPFHLRPQPHSLVETLNPELPSSSSGVPQGSKTRISLSSTSDPKAWGYRYMFEKISQRSEALDDLIDEFAQIIKEAYGITELGDPNFVSEEPIYAVGRIMSPPTDAGKVSAGNLVLESSRLLGGGKRVGLRWAATGLKVRGGAPGVKSFGVFPGCMVCVKGRNGGGGMFVVDEVLLPPPSELAQSAADELLDLQYGDRLQGEPVSMMIAAGPFTLEDDFSYAPLAALVDVVIAERPDVLILLGPFVDSQHPLIQTGNVTQLPADIFRDQVSARLQRILDSSPGTNIILSPSIRDIVSRHVAYPQAMLDKDILGIPKKVKSLPNPCTFSINETVISITSTDTLFHLRREEVLQRAEEAEPDPEAKSGETKDAMAGLVRHLLGQRSFYPIFPPPEAHAGEVNLDVTHYGLLKMEGCAPDVLVLPSKLKHFSKIVDSTLVVNPAHISRAHSAGTFAKILVHPMKRDELESSDMDVDGGDMREHKVYERARSEIWRI
ncbi:DNA polymerase alpha subunit B N-terminal-domain-containing protein [Naematelia encephala]|uniref:DNA polymerase alpha subunit B n=1 Tax=Naematelia encephala TaxID=71784 RepID=A0A1Y2BBS1_9TREE|nr:DNA polymerase alpha subunit B N-terminal-domain-containing protein [Naematelia encephala]